MISYLLFGFFVGMSHALEADHLAAVGTLAAKADNSAWRMSKLGAAWGLGHTTTLCILGALVVVFGFSIDDLMANILEFVVGCMLVGLGGNVLFKLKKSGVHFHAHSHADGRTHMHAHTHNHAIAPHGSHHSKENHNHEHATGFSLRAFLIGLVHGAAGTAGLLLIVVAATQDPMLAMLYIVLFGLGSMCGMAILTYAISWPLRLSTKFAKKTLTLVQGAAGCLAIYIGIEVLVETGTPILQHLFASV